MAQNQTQPNQNQPTNNQGQNQPQTNQQPQQQGSSPWKGILIGCGIGCFLIVIAVVILFVVGVTKCGTGSFRDLAVPPESSVQE